MLLLFLFSVFRPHRVGSSLKHSQLSAVQGDNFDGDNVIILVIMMIFMMVVMFLVVRMVVVLGHNCSGSDTNTSLIICDDDHMNPFIRVYPILFHLLVRDFCCLAWTLVQTGPANVAEP